MAQPPDGRATVRSVCPYCGVGCGIVMHVEDNLIVKVSGDKQHPANQGRLCTKGSTCGQAVAVGGRMEQAFMRQDRSREPAQVGLASAIQATAQRLKTIIDTHGGDAVALYVSGQMSLEAQYLANKLAKGFIRTQHIESNSRLCMASAGSGYKLSLGADGPPGAYDDFDHSDVFLVIGANMADCHPVLFLRLLDRVKAGARLIVVDPRRTGTADKAGLYLQILPGTDLVLLNGLLHLLVKNGHTDADFIARFTEGWEVMEDFLQAYTPERVAQLTGLPEAAIRQAAQWVGEAGNWMSCWTMGLNQSVQGTWHTNALCNLHLATGAICRTGSGPFSLTGQPNAMGGREMGYMGPGLPGQRSASVAQDRAFIEALWGLPAGTLRAEGGKGTVAMFQAMAAGDIKACWIICTNPVASVPNRQQVIDGLQQAELVVTQDAYLDTETNRYADILLPGALWAEAEGVMINSERNLTLTQKAVQAPGEALADWELIARVACAMGYAHAFSYTSAAEVFEEIKGAWNPATGYDLRGASHERLRQQPLQWPCAPEAPAARNAIRYRLPSVAGPQPHLVFPTENGKARFFARPHLPPAEHPDEAFPWVLTTGRVQHQWHTMTKTGRVAALNTLNPGPFVEVHPQDAARLNILPGVTVRIQSRRGSAALPAVISDRVRPGTCFAPFHWNDVFGEQLAINAVTSDAVDPISLQPAFKYCAVGLAPEAAVAEAQPVLTDAQIKPRFDAAEGARQPIETFARLLGLDSTVPLTLSADQRRYMEGYLLGLRNAEPGPHSVPRVPDSAPFDAPQRLLLNGVLAGLFSGIAPEQASSSPQWLVLWASQTGNGERLAATCAQRLTCAGRLARVQPMADACLDHLRSAEAVLLVTSTFGDGEPPDNAAGFWQALQAAPPQSLAGTRFTVLALGDSSYAQFCGFGRTLDDRLAALGAERIRPRLECEPEYEDVAEQWLSQLCETFGVAGGAVTGEALAGGALAGSEPMAPMPRPTSTSAVPVAEGNPYTRQQPLSTRLLSNRRLNGKEAEKDTRHLVFDLSGVNFPYEAGDALGVWPVNDVALVDEVLAVIGCDGSTPVQLKHQAPMTFRQALTEHLEIARIHPDTLRRVASQGRHALLQAYLEEGQQAPLQAWLWGRQLADLLRECPLVLEPQHWVDVLKPLQPRVYSISSSPAATPEEVHLTVATVRYEHQGRSRGGVCSTFLADRAEAEPVRIFLQRSAHFRVPQDPAVPLIMVGPGTGIAPFRAFLQERQARGGSGKNWVFFGEQRALTDYYYRNEFLDWQRSGLLQRLDTAFSRDQADKVYVQQRMLEAGAELWQWLEEGAHVCVCGDASRMAKDVDAALKQIVQRHGKMSSGAAALYVSTMSKARRYLRDVY